MLFSVIKTKVRANMPVEANRQGTQTVLDNLIKQCLMDLQYYIKCYEQTATIKFTEADVTIIGHASQGSLPYGTKITHAKLIYPESIEDDVDTIASPDKCGHAHVSFKPWTQRFQTMICHTPKGFNGVMTIDPKGENFLVRPILQTDKVELELEYRYIKQTFEDTDDVAIDEQAIYAISNYVKAYLSIDVDEDEKTAANYNAVWQEELQKLYVKCRERSAVGIG